MPVQLQTTQGFIDKLNTAIVTERKTISELKVQVEQARQVWFEKRARVKAMQNLLEKVTKNEQVKLDRQEQKMLDDLASQQFLKSNV